MTEIEVRAPYDGELIRTVAASGAEEVEAALATAYGLFRDRAGWLPPAARVKILREAARLMQDQAAELAREAAHEGGKPLVDSQVEVARAIHGVLHYAELLRSKAATSYQWNSTVAWQAGSRSCSSSRSASGGKCLQPPALETPQEAVVRAKAASVAGSFIGFLKAA